jgi:hypothetical protein
MIPTQPLPFADVDYVLPKYTRWFMADPFHSTCYYFRYFFNGVYALFG